MQGNMGLTKHWMMVVGYSYIVCLVVYIYTSLVNHKIYSLVLVLMGASTVSLYLIPLS